MVDAYTVQFNSSATVGQRECYTFRPVQDTTVESDETMRFEIMTEYLLDEFGDSNRFTVVIYDDDGKGIMILAKKALRISRE